MKEEEKNEKIIRSLLKLAHNKRCINCNSLVSLFSTLFFFINPNKIVTLPLGFVRDHNMFALLSGLLFVPTAVEYSKLLLLSSSILVLLFDLIYVSLSLSLSQP